MTRAAAAFLRTVSLPVLTAAVLALLLVAPSSGAEGGATIASAPMLTSGALETGTGAHDVPGGGSSGHDFGHAFWRIRVFAGDSISGSGSESQDGGCLDSMWLFDPSVSDANLDQAKPTLMTAVTHSGGRCDSRTFRWVWSVVPFSGLATLWAEFGYGNTFEFSARISHRTVLPPPVPGKKVNAARIRGKVLVDGRELTSPEQVRVGAVIDTTKGEIRLITKNGDADFFSGIFQLRQGPARNAVTELRMRGGNFGVCKKRVRQASLETPLRSKKPVRKLWGKGKGKFRTRARYSSATVRGTYWLTSDRCDGTLTTVREGTVTALDFVRHKTVIVKKGHSYLARPRR